MNCTWLTILIVITSLTFQSCDAVNKKKRMENFAYESFRDSVRKEMQTVKPDTSNVFEEEDVFIPGVDSLDSLLVKIDTLWHREALLMDQLDTLIRHYKDQEVFTAEEKAVIRENIAALDSFRANQNNEKITACKEKDCLLYVEVIKSTQTLYLYLDGELKDSFKVSTGMKGYETPVMDLNPRGPIFTKYTSRKFPGGNYKGLGNMPYAVFIKGGYAIHGTTPGNFAKLGKKASHGCIRLHPDNAIIFNELVKLVGLANTWVRVMEDEENKVTEEQ